LNVKTGVSISVIVLFSIQLLAGPVVTTADQNVATPIKHVVVIMMENHSFDNIFGLYPTMNKTNSAPLMQSLQAPNDVLSVPSNVGLMLTQVPNGTYWTANPDELVYYNDWDNGKMDGFAANSGSQSMTYYSSSQLAIEWDWAEQYAIADNYFSSCLCQTNPNRLFSLAGYAAGLMGDVGPPPYIPANQSIFGELNHYGVSWSYYLKNPRTDNFPLGYFDGIGAYSSNIKSWSSFNASLLGGTLPSVAWVMPVGGGASGVDQHPASNMTQGEDWLLGIINSIMQSSYWNSTAIFISYDEGGGYYDHVPPPVLDGVQLGFRVPLFLISPYAKENYVSNTVMNHASILAFIDYNWHIPALNQFVADSNIPLDMFNFQVSSPRAPLLLSPGSKFPVNLQIPPSQLPYPRQGQTNHTLAFTGSLFVQNNSTTAPFYESIPFVVTVSAILLVGAVGTVVYGFRRFKRYTPAT
jgi:phospholipase C